MADKLEVLTTLADSRLFGHLKPDILKTISEIGEEIVVSSFINPPAPPGPWRPLHFIAGRVTRNRLAKSWPFSSDITTGRIGSRAQLAGLKLMR